MTTHGMRHSAEYRIWADMVARCTRPTNRSFKNYGGRGITLYAEWRKDFAAFYKYIGAKPSAHHSLDRIDNNKGYEPGNIRWATLEEQNSNKRNNRLVYYQGQQMTVARAARAAGAIVTTQMALARMRLRWSVDKAVEAPIQSWGGDRRSGAARP